jgi:hypothetical protein
LNRVNPCQFSTSVHFVILHLGLNPRLPRRSSSSLHWFLFSASLVIHLTLKLTPCFVLLFATQISASVYIADAQTHFLTCCDVLASRCTDGVVPSEPSVGRCPLFLRIFPIYYSLPPRSLGPARRFSGSRSVGPCLDLALQLSVAQFSFCCESRLSRCCWQLDLRFGNWLQQQARAIVSRMSRPNSVFLMESCFRGVQICGAVLGIVILVLPTGSLL